MNIEITKQAVHGSERFELHLGGGIYIFSLKRGERLARNILSHLGIDVAQLEDELKIEKQKHLDTSNWAMEQQDRAERTEAIGGES